jgi:hypothetical protein
MMNSPKFYFVMCFKLVKLFFLGVYFCWKLVSFFTSLFQSSFDFPTGGSSNIREIYLMKMFLAHIIFFLI